MCYTLFPLLTVGKLIPTLKKTHYYGLVLSRILQVLNPRKNCLNSEHIHFLCLIQIFARFLTTHKRKTNHSTLLIVTQHLLSAGSDIIIKNAQKFELLYVDKFLEYVLKWKKFFRGFTACNWSLQFFFMKVFQLREI